MYWGRGDSSKLSAEERVALEHLRRLSETGHIIGIDPEKAAAAVRAIEFWSQWESMFKLFTSLRNTALLVGAMLAIYWGTQGWIVDFIKGAAAP